MKIFIKIIIFFCITSFLINQKISAEEKIKIGLLVPITGENSEIGKSIINTDEILSKDLLYEIDLAKRDGCITNLIGSY